MMPHTQVFYTTLTLAALMGIIVIFFVISILRYHRRYIKLQKERMLAEITMQENERRRIAADLHDSMGPMLSTIKLNISSIDVNDKEDQRIVTKTSGYIDEMIKSMRQISYNLMPNTLERKGLVYALREFTVNFNEQRDMQIHLQIIEDIDIPKEKAVHIFRILQEITHNTLKHARAKKLHIGITKERQQILILTKDDGIGFDVNTIKEQSGGLGLKSLESRCEVMNGTLSLESKKGEGTSYIIKIPL